jgi:hypothetical protein
MNRRERRHSEQDPWDDFSYSGFAAGWLNLHRRWRGRSLLWALGVAGLFVLLICVLIGLVFRFVG